MVRMKTSRWLLAVAFLVGCGDEPRNIGDSDAGQVDVPGVDIGARDTGSGDTGPVDTGRVDAGPADTGPADTGPEDTGPVDTGSTPDDTGPVDAGSPVDVVTPMDLGVDAGPADTGPMDTGPADTGPLDAGPRDTGPLDAGPTDTGPRDTGPGDTGPRDTGPGDTGPADTGVVCTPATETCNGRDDDCDGLVDEGACGTHLVISEVVMSPTTGEFVEIYNPTSAPIALGNVYLADSADYPCRLAGVTCMPAAGSVQAADFVARFPEGAGGSSPMIGPGQYVTISLSDPASFRMAYGRCPDYYVRGVADSQCATATVMRSAGATGTNTIGTGSGLTDTGEPLVLFSWDGTSPRVVDLDHVYFGSPSSAANARVSKTGLMATVNGMTATYLNDTAAEMQSMLAAHGSGRSLVRCDFSEGTERRTGGNGFMGHDETSENWMQTWRSSPAASPGMPSVTPGAENNCR